MSEPIKRWRVGVSGSVILNEDDVCQGVTAGDQTSTYIVGEYNSLLDRLVQAERMAEELRQCAVPQPSGEGSFETWNEANPPAIPMWVISSIAPGALEWLNKMIDAQRRLAYAAGRGEGDVLLEEIAVEMENLWAGEEGGQYDQGFASGVASCAGITRARKWKRA